MVVCKSVCSEAEDRNNFTPTKRVGHKSVKFTMCRSCERTINISTGIYGGGMGIVCKVRMRALKCSEKTKAIFCSS